MEANKKIIEDGVHTIRGQLSTVATFLEMNEDGSFVENDRAELLVAAKQSLAVVCTELSRISTSLKKIVSTGR